MKTNPIMMINFLLVAITASAVCGQKEAVRDSDGNPVKANTPYLVDRGEILGRSISSYMLVESGKVSPQLCSKGVAMFKSVGPTRVSIVFVLSSDDVRVSTQLNIKFKILPKPQPKPNRPKRRPNRPNRRPNRPNRRPSQRTNRPSQPLHSCTESMFWRVGQNNSRYEDLLLLGGSQSSNDSTFTIEKSNNNLYKFAFAGADIGLDNESLTSMRKMRLLRDSDVLGEFSFFPASE